MIKLMHLEQILTEFAFLEDLAITQSWYLSINRPGLLAEDALKVGCIYNIMIYIDKDIVKLLSFRAQGSSLWYISTP